MPITQCIHKMPKVKGKWLTFRYSRLSMSHGGGAAPHPIHTPHTRTNDQHQSHQVFLLQDRNHRSCIRTGLSQSSMSLVSLPWTLFLLRLVPASLSRAVTRPASDSSIQHTSHLRQMTNTNTKTVKSSLLKTAALVATPIALAFGITAMNVPSAEASSTQCQRIGYTVQCYHYNY